MERNWSYTIKEGEHAGQTLWSGRYCAVCAIVFCKTQYGGKEGKWCVLANKRGSGTPDFQGLWNMPCGFIEKGESGEQAAARETEEETGLFVYPSDFSFWSVETDPNTSNNGNITLRYITQFTRKTLPALKNPTELETLGLGGEKDEVEVSEWIPLDEIENYQWAFHHKELIYKVKEFLKE